MRDDKESSIKIALAKDFSDIKNENESSFLNECGFVRTVSAREQWILLVNDAWKLTRLPENELVRDYLSSMLERYLLQCDLYERLSNFNYLYRLLNGENIDPLCMQDIADISLMYVSFVPQRDISRHEPRKLDYSYELGESLYQQLSIQSEGKDDWFSLAYKEMAKLFGRAVMVLRSVNMPRFKEITGVHNTDALKIPSTEEANDIVQKYLLNTRISTIN